MKAFNLFFLFSFALLFIQCKDKSNQEKTSTNDSDEKISTSFGDGTISVTVYDNNTEAALSDVEIEIQEGGVTSGHDTTNLNGQATLTNVNGIKDYTFKKQGFTPQSIQFPNYIEIQKLYVYMKPSGGTISPTINVSGMVYGGAGNPIGNALVSSNESRVRSQQNGSYSLDVQSNDSVFPLNYLKGSVQGGLSMFIQDDSVFVDVFIDGFTIDTIFSN